MYDEYLISDGKVPITKLKDKLSWEDVKNEASITLVLKPNEMVVDVDNKEDSNKILQMVKDLNIQTLVRETERGHHFKFLIPEGMQLKNGAGIYSCVGIKCDYKLGSRNAVECIRKNNVDRKIVYGSPESIQPLPAFLYQTKSGNKISKVIEEYEPSNRNNSYFKIAATLNSEGMSHAGIQQTLQCINNAIVAEPLSGKEIATISQSATHTRETLFTGKLDPNEIGEYLRNKYQIKIYNSVLYLYTPGNGYNSDPIELANSLYDIAPQIKPPDMKYVEQFISTRCKKYGIGVPSEHLVQCKNGVVNMYTGEVTDFDPDKFTPLSIPVYYDADADTSEVEKALRKYANYDDGIYQILLEFIAYIFFPKNNFKKLFILIGNGSNGKSMFTKIVEKFIGKEHCTALSLQDLNHEFKVAALASSLLNIGNDISSNIIEDTAALKQLTGNDTINANVKNRDPIEFECRAKPIFSCNKLPMTKEKGYALYNRLVILPFSYDFDHDPEALKFDLDKFCSNNNMSALLKLVMPYYKKIYNNQRFTMTTSIINTILNFICVNDIVAEYYITEIQKKGTVDASLFAFEQWLELNDKSGIRISPLTFTENFSNIHKYYQHLIEAFDYEKKTKY